MAEIVTLYGTNSRDVPGTLRRLADDVERGEWGRVRYMGITLKNETDMEVFGIGPEYEPHSLALLFYSAFKLLLEKYAE